LDPSQRADTSGLGADQRPRSPRENAVEGVLRELRRTIFDGELRANEALRQDDLAFNSAPVEIRCAKRSAGSTSIRERIEDVDNIREARGVSTITQQTAKNLFLWPGRSFVRKALELPLALWMDLLLPKWRVLEIYLNIAEWGPSGQFGAEAASRNAFNKSAHALSPREAALLAAVLPNPRRRSARRPGPLVRRLAAIYEARGIAQAALAPCAKPATLHASLDRARSDKGGS
jgi:hypothetical protein